MGILWDYKPWGLKYFCITTFLSHDLWDLTHDLWDFAGIFRGFKNID